MARKISFIVTNDGSICAFANGKALPPVAKDHRDYQEIKAAIAADDVAKLTKLTEVAKSVASFSSGKAEVKDGVVYYNGRPLHNGMTDRIITLMCEGFPFQPMLNFLENLQKNPSHRATNELYDFLAYRGLPITEDGHFLGYKRVRDNFTDIHSGTYDNSVGKVVEMPRNQVDDNREVGCSEGLHVGTIEYVRGFSGNGCEKGGNVVIVKVNPADVVSVPKENGCQKLRACRYEVIGMYEGDLVAPLYNSDGGSVSPSFDNDSDLEEDEDYDDEDYDDEDEDDESDDDEDEDEVVTGSGEDTEWGL